MYYSAFYHQLWECWWFFFKVKWLIDWLMLTILNSGTSFFFQMAMSTWDVFYLWSGIWFVFERPRPLYYFITFFLLTVLTLIKSGWLLLKMMSCTSISHEHITKLSHNHAILSIEKNKVNFFKINYIRLIFIYTLNNNKSFINEITIQSFWFL